MLESLLIYLPLFFLAVIFCFTIPGILLISRTDMGLIFWEKIVLGSAVGLVIFSLLSFVLLVVKAHFLLLPLILIINLLAIKTLLNLPKKIGLFHKKYLMIFLLVFIFGVVGQMAIIAPSGLLVGKDLIFFSSHGHDGSWHISLMEEIKKGFPLQNPVFAGEKLVNYHFFSDIAPAMFNKFFLLPPLDLYFRFFPLVYSLLLGGTAFILGKKIGGSFSAGLWSTIFTYFTGSLGFIVTLMQKRGIGGEGVFWVSQVQSTIGNPPQIAASIIVLTFLIFFIYFLTKRNWALFFTLVLLLGTLPVLKVYAGVVLFLSLGLVSIWQLAKERSLHLSLMTTLGAILAASLYLPFSSGTQKFLIFEPWWFIRTMVVASDKLNWIDLELKRQTYVAENNLKRVVQIELTAFLIFFFGNLGVRSLGLFYLYGQVRHLFKSYFSLLFFSIMLTSFILPMLFLQKGVASNTGQFFQYFLLLMGIAAGISTAKILRRFNLFFKTVFIASIIFLAVPTQIGLLYNFYGRPPVAKISSDEMQALTFLKATSDPSSIIVSPPYNQYLDLKEPTPHMWDWFDTSYIAAFSAKRVFLSDTEQVDIMGYDLKKRLEIQKSIFEIENPVMLKTILTENRIGYLYFPKQLKPKSDLLTANLDKVFENSLVEIWRVN